MLGVVGVLTGRRFRKRAAEVLSSGNPAFTHELDIDEMRQDPEEWRGRLGGKIAIVHTTVVTMFGPDGTHTRFNSFVIDTNGESHDVETSGDQVKVELNAKFVAELFGVEYEPL